MEGANFSPRNRKKNYKKCCVKNCKSKYMNENCTIRLHSAPIAGETSVFIKNHFGVDEIVDKLYAWEKALKLKLNSSMKICSL